MSHEERHRREKRRRIEQPLERMGMHSWFVMRLVAGGWLTLGEADGVSFRACLSGNLTLDARVALEELEIEEAKRGAQTDS